MAAHGIKRYLYIFSGFLSLFLGITGIFIPVLPTTPFLLLSSFCFLRSSKRLYEALLSHRILGQYIYNYITYKAIPKRTKYTMMAFLWLTLTASILLVAHLHIRILLAVVGALVSIHLCTLKTMKEDSRYLSQKTEGRNMEENKTLSNLMEAFAGESQANKKYLAYAKKAEAEGFTNAAKLFRAASDAETLHALKHLETAGKIGATADNLKDAVAGETHEYTSMYPPFLAEAEKEGNKAAIRTFTLAMKAEEVHAGLYKEALEGIGNKEEVFYYLCPVCGNIEKAVPDKCFICGAPGAKFIRY